MILYIENTKTLHQKIIRTIDISSEITVYKINIEKSVVFLYTNNELSERKINNKIPFKIASKIIKTHRNKLTKEVKNLYIEN